MINSNAFAVNIESLKPEAKDKEEIEMEELF